MEYKYKRELTSDEKMAELEAQLQKGNHKGALTQEYLPQKFTAEAERQKCSIWDKSFIR